VNLRVLSGWLVVHGGTKEKATTKDTRGARRFTKSALPKLSVLFAHRLFADREFRNQLFAHFVASTCFVANRDQSLR